jgi:hypothetical protein
MRPCLIMTAFAGAIFAAGVLTLTDRGCTVLRAMLPEL